MSDIIDKLNELEVCMNKTLNGAKNGYKHKTIENIELDIEYLNDIIKQANEQLETTKPALPIDGVSVSFADFLLTHKQSDEVQKAVAHQLFKEFIEAYER